MIIELLSTKSKFFFLKLRQFGFRDFCDFCEFVISFALKKINQGYKALTTTYTVLFACTKLYNIKANLSCKHMIQNRFFTSSNVISLKNVYSHWRFFKRTFTINRGENQNANDDSFHTIDNDCFNINVNSLLFV